MLVVPGAVDDPGLLREVSHSFLRERGPDDIAGLVFTGLCFPGMDVGAAEDLKTGMPPGFQQIRKIGSDFAFSEKPGKTLERKANRRPGPRYSALFYIRVHVYTGMRW